MPYTSLPAPTARLSQLWWSRTETLASSERSNGAPSARPFLQSHAYALRPVSVRASPCVRRQPSVLSVLVLRLQLLPRFRLLWQPTWVPLLRVAAPAVVRLSCERLKSFRTLMFFVGLSARQLWVLLLTLLSTHFMSPAQWRPASAARPNVPPVFRVAPNTVTFFVP